VTSIIGDATEAVEGAIEEWDVIVLTQTCDLENNKVDEVLLAAVTEYAALVDREKEKNPVVAGRKFRSALVDGNMPAYSLLPQRLIDPVLAWSLVDFHHLFSVPKAQLLAHRAAGDRLRLASPYREHLAQAFARYIMRVGLPTPLQEFEMFKP